MYVFVPRDSNWSPGGHYLLMNGCTEWIGARVDVEGGIRAGVELGSGDYNSMEIVTYLLWHGGKYM